MFQVSRTWLYAYNDYDQPRVIILPYVKDEELPPRESNTTNYVGPLYKVLYFGGNDKPVASFFSVDGLGYESEISSAVRPDGAIFESVSAINGDVQSHMYQLSDTMGRPIHRYYTDEAISSDRTPLYGENWRKHEAFSYDAAGNKTEEKIYSTDWTGYYSEFYDAPDYQRTLEKHTTYEYDTFNRMIKRTEAPDDSNLITQFGYDALGNMTYVVHPDGYAERVDYDNANRKIREYFSFAPPHYYAMTSDDPKVKTEYTYYDNDQLKSVTSYDYAGAQLSFTEYTYDKRGRKASVIENIDASTQAVTNYTYSDTGMNSPIGGGDPCLYHIKIEKVTDAASTDTYISLEFHGQPHKIVYPSLDYEEMTYHGHGLLKTKTVWDGVDKSTVDYEYDAYGKLKQKIYTYNGAAPQEYIDYAYTDRIFGEYGQVATITDHRDDGNRPGDSAGSSYNFTYDSHWSQNLLSYEGDNGTSTYTVNYEYSNAFNKKTKVEVVTGGSTIYDVGYNYDMAGRLVDVNASNGSSIDEIAGFTYTEGQQNLQGATYYLDGNLEDDKLNITYDYTGNNQLAYIDATVNSQTDPVYNFDASASPRDFDGLGRLDEATEKIMNSSSQLKTHNIDFAYDRRSQLTGTSISNISGAANNTWEGNYVYNKDGNIDERTLDGDTDEFQYTGDLMTGIVDTATFIWNDNGQLITGPSSIAYKYNWDGKLRHAKDGTNHLRIKYDPMGNRVWRRYPNSSATPTKYVVDIVGNLPVVLCEIEGSSVTRSYIHTNDGRLIAQRAGGQNAVEYFYVTDRLGSVRLLVDSAGAVKNRYSYDPFGNTFSTESEEAVTNNFMFTGQWHDSEIDQYYMRARMSDPDMMRFTRRDPIDGVFNRPQTLNKYLYCRNDPVNLLDPSGLDAYYLTFGYVGEWYGSIAQQVGIAWDDKGGWGLMYMTGVGVGYAGITGNFNIGITNAYDIWSLNGPGFAVGGSIGRGFFGAGVELVGSEGVPETDLKNYYRGLEFSAGVGFSKPYAGRIHHTTTTIIPGGSLNRTFEEVMQRTAGNALQQAQTWAHYRWILHIMAITDTDMQEVLMYY